MSVGNIVPLYHNPQVAIITEEEQDEQDQPINWGEEQFDAVAQPKQAVESVPTAATWERIINKGRTIMNESQKTQLIALLLTFSSIFSQGPADIGHTQLMRHDIDVGGATPKFQAQYRIPHAYRSLVQEQMSNLRQAQIITPSNSPWTSPLVVVRKKSENGNIKIRCCLDLRGVNKLIKLKPYPLPRIDDLIDSVSQAKLLTTLDMTAAYSAAPQ